MSVCYSSFFIILMTYLIPMLRVEVAGFKVFLASKVDMSCGFTMLPQMQFDGVEQACADTLVLPYCIRSVLILIVHHFPCKLQQQVAIVNERFTDRTEWL